MVGTTAAKQPLPAVSLRSGTVGRAASRAAIAWCDLGRAVVWESVASGRNWMVLLAYRAHRAPDVAQGVLKEVQRGMCQWRAVFEGAVSAYRIWSPQPTLSGAGCGPRAEREREGARAIA